MPQVLKLMETEYPISNEARETIDSARARSVAFNTRRILNSGGFGPDVVEAVVEAAVTASTTGQQITVGFLQQSLEAKGIKPDQALQLAHDLAPAA